MDKNKLSLLLAMVFALSVAMFFSAGGEAWRREPALELAILSVLGLAALKALMEGNGL